MNRVEFPVLFFIIHKHSFHFLIVCFELYTVKFLCYNLIIDKMEVHLWRKKHIIMAICGVPLLKQV